MAGCKELSRRQKMLLRVKSALPILKESWVSLNEHISNGDMAAIRTWLNKRPYIRSKVQGVSRNVLNPICTAAEAGDVTIFDLLVDTGFSPFADDCRKDEIETSPRRRPLHLACHKGHLDLVKNLVEMHNEDVNSYGGGNTPLQWSVLGRHVDMVKYLLDHRADPNIGDQMEVDMLTVMKGSANYHYWHDECYPLGKAFNRGIVDIAVLLIHAGADDRKVRISGSTLISNFVSKTGIRDITQMLYERGAYMPMRDLFEYVCYADFEKHKDLIIPIWQFLLDMDVSLYHLNSVPPQYSVPYSSAYKRVDLLQQISESNVFGDDVPLAEIVLKTLSRSNVSSFKGFQTFDESCQSYLSSSNHQVCCLKYLCCLKIRQGIGIVSTKKLEFLPTQEKLKKLIRLEEVLH